MITLPLTALIVVCLSIGAIIGLAVATIIQVNKGEDGDATYIDRQAALAQQQEAEPVLFALGWPSDGSRNQINSSTVFDTQEAAEDYRGRCSDHHTISVTPLYIHPPEPAAQPQAHEGIHEKYHELLYHVARAFPDESRHETALRYIKNAESAESYCAAAKEEGK